MSKKESEEKELNEDDLEKAVGGVITPDGLSAPITRRLASSGQADVADARGIRDADDSGSRQIKPF